MTQAIPNSTCLNCSASLNDSQAYCGSCGQKVTAGRLTLHEIAHEALHAFVHVDSSILALLRDLVFRPGYVARDFVAGKRKRHFGPFAFLVIAVGLATSLMLLIKVPWFQPIGENSLSEELQRHFNLIYLVQVPILAQLCSLLFREQKLFYAEHLILAAYTTGFRVLIAGFVIAPLVHFVGLSVWGLWSISIYNGFWWLYFAVAAKQFYALPSVGSAWRAVLAAALTQAVTGFLITSIVYGYFHTVAQQP